MKLGPWEDFACPEDGCCRRPYGDKSEVAFAVLAVGPGEFRALALIGTPKGPALLKFFHPTKARARKACDDLAREQGHVLS
jgi:hypothetical protein